jgi:MFS family permease
MAASPATTASRERRVALGLGDNLGQFSLLVVMNALVGTVVGTERSVLPLLAESDFAIVSTTAILSFLVAFGLAKAVANLVAGAFAPRIGGRRILLIGWLLAVPIPGLLWWAPAWEWVVLANLLLGANQGLAWSATVLMKIDLVGPARRGLAMGLNECAGYVAVSLGALGAGYMAAAHGPRSGPVWIAAAAIILGLVSTVLFVRDTRAHVELEEALSDRPGRSAIAPLPAGLGARLRSASFGSRPLFGANQAGLVNNLNDGMAWGLLPLYLASSGAGVREIAWLAALYPAVWGVAQVGTGALSDHAGRRALIRGGMLVQAAALAMFAGGSGVRAWAAAAILLGLGTAAVYPTLIAQVSDLVRPRDRAGAVGVYRMWRDLGYVAGALLSGVLADLFGFRAAILAIAVVTAGSGLLAGRLLAGGDA